MDIRCRTCGEPWDIDSIAEAGALDTFRAKGCVSLGTSHTKGTRAHPIVGTMMDLLGDDIDGIAAELEDLRYMGIDLMEGVE